MYICKDCKTEYKTKVEYCDCGNNTFDFIDDTPKKIVQRQISLEQKKQLLSIGFFIVCLILSAIVWLIPIKQKHKQPSQTTVKIETSKNIPNIDKIWKDTSEVVEKKNEPVKVEPKKVVQNITKTTQKVKVQETKKTTPKKVQTEKIQQPIKDTPKSEITETPKVVEKIVEQTTKPPVKVEVKPAYNPNSSEMIKYKTKLRATLFTKLPVGSIQGSGSCDIEFAVDKTGKLINRKFTKESDNKTLNDAVYYMLMSVPKFTPPPANYNAEPIRMNFKFNNGNYEITIN